MFLRELPRIFTWEEPSPELVTLHGRYVELLARRLGQRLSGLSATAHRHVAEDIQSLLQRLPNEALAQTLAAPEVSYRLLWPQHHEDGEAAAFIRAALLTAEAALHGTPVDGIRWLAAGNAYVDTGGRVTRPWGSPGGLPVDGGSPWALSSDVSGERVRSDTPKPPLEQQQLRAALATLQAAVDCTQRSVPHAWRMAHDFTKALILLPDGGAPEQFSSGSSGQFVGRSVLANPHLAKVTRVQLAEGLVHEAIHSVLYMDEQHDPWVLDAELYAGPMRITSPWTGNRLPLRPFLQASFVWYGLLAFWSRALAGGAFPEEQVHQRLTESASGFLRVDLLEQVASVSDRLSPELVEAVRELQDRVRTVLAMAEAD